MKILIVGGAGYLGGYMTDHLIKSGHEVSVFDNLLYESRFMKPVNFIFGDIRDTTALESIIHAYDCVVWLAAVVGDGACSVNHNLTIDINLNSVMWLAEKYNGKVVFASTCSVYGKNDDMLDENSPTNPLSLYASTKLQAEAYLRSKKPDSIIWRLGTLFGLGDEHSRFRADLVANILTIKATRGEPLTVFGGDQWRPLLHVRDVAHATRFAIENNISGTYNLSYKNYRLIDIANEIVQNINGSTLLETDLAFEDMRNYKVSSDRIRSKGWTASLTLKDGIEEIRSLVLNKRVKDLSDPIYSNAAFLKKIGSF